MVPNNEQHLMSVIRNLEQQNAYYRMKERSSINNNSVNNYPNSNIPISEIDPMSQRLYQPRVNSQGSQKHNLADDQSQTQSIMELSNISISNNFNNEKKNKVKYMSEKNSKINVDNKNEIREE